MLLLFLDTETSALSPAKGQVIEIGGILAKLDPIDLKLKEIATFESLLFLRSENLDEKITRITGITEKELLKAPDLFQVQEAWLNWLTPYNHEIQAIIGHSINFDLGFLMEEKWFLPENAKNIDTLDLSRVFFPNFQAINLEHLSKKLELLDMNTAQSHRSLSDTRFNLKLFEKILQRIKNLEIENSFFEEFKKYFLPLNLDFLNQNQNTDLLEINQNQSKSNQNLENKTSNLDNFLENPENPIKINIFGKKIEEGFWERYNRVLLNLKIQDFKELFNLQLPQDLKLSLYQIYIAFVIKQKNPELDLKFHLPGNPHFIYWFKILLDTLEQKTSFANSENNLKNETKLEKDFNLEDKDIILTSLEDIVFKTQFLYQENLNFGKIISLLEFFKNILEIQFQVSKDLVKNQFKAQNQNSFEISFSTANLQKIPKNTKEILKKIQLAVNSYDFLLLNLQSFLFNHKFLINPRNTDWKEMEVKNRFGSFMENLLEIKEILSFEPKKELQSLILQNLLQEILKELGQINYNPNYFYNLSIQGEDLYVSFRKRDFSILSHFQEILEKPKTIQIETDLDEDNFQKLLTLAGLKKLFERKTDLKINSQTLKPVEKVDRMNLEDFYDSLIKKCKLEKKPILILSGLNSSLKDSQKVLTENFTPEEYLILGESGSMTKILSKLLNGFSSVAVLKVSNFKGITNYLDKIDLQEIWFLNQPFLWMDNYWKNQSKLANNPEEFLEQIRKLNLVIQFQKVSKIYEGRVKFLRSY